MRQTFRFRSFPSTAAMMPWLLQLLTRALAHSLNMPEPVVHGTGAFVFAHVQAVENRVGRALCPVRLWLLFQNQLRAWLCRLCSP